MELPNFDGLLDKKLTRKEFLGYIGTLALGIIGVMAIKNSLSQATKQASRSLTTEPSPANSSTAPTASASKPSLGYGSSPYSAKG